MKKLQLLCITAIMMAGCLEISSSQKEKIKSLDTYDWGATYYTPNGCEYYIYNNSHGGIPIHKQDCKKCKERRQKEIREIINDLKK